MKTKPKILLVDDKLENIIAIETVLQDLNVEFVRALSGNEALEKTLDNDFALALIDVQMPEMDGYETVKLLRQSQKTKVLPIIYVSAVYSEHYYADDGSDTDAIDFISKPIIPILLINKVKAFLEIYNYRKDLEIEIEKRKIAEERISSQKEQLELMNKILRHDLINYFTITKSALDLYNYEDDKSMMKEAYNSIDKGCDLIYKMGDLNILLERNPEMRTFNLNDVIESVKPEYPSLKFTISGKGNVICNEIIHSVFNNIFSNAERHGNAKNISINISAKDNFYEIRIANDGTNIPDDIKEKVFDESFSYGESGQSGIGLYIVKKAIENFGGSIYVEDNKPQGVVFVIKLLKADGDE